MSRQYAIPRFGTFTDAGGRQVSLPGFGVYEETSQHIFAELLPESVAASYAASAELVASYSWGEGLTAADPLVGGFLLTDPLAAALSAAYSQAGGLQLDRALPEPLAANCSFPATAVYNGNALGAALVAHYGRRPVVGHGEAEGGGYGEAGEGDCGYGDGGDPFGYDIYGPEYVQFGGLLFAFAHGAAVTALMTALSPTDFAHRVDAQLKGSRDQVANLQGSMR